MRTLKILSTSLTVSFLFVLSIGILPSHCTAKTFYIDYQNGNDGRLGTSVGESWKHCPGDVAAAANAKTQALQPGDVVIFKGGVEYPGELDLRWSGAPGKPILFDGNTEGSFGDGRAVFSGAQKIENWRPASSENVDGAANWQSCLVADLPVKIDPFALNLFYDDKRGVVARDNNIKDPFWWQELDDYTPVPDNDITKTSVKLPLQMAAPAGRDWKDGFIGVWSLSNHIDLRSITATSSDGNYLAFEAAQPRKNGNLIALFNHARLLDQRGEYAVVNQGQRLIFYNGAQAAPPQVTISTRRYGINLNGQSHVILKGLAFRRFAGDTTDRRAGGGIISWKSGSSQPQDIVIENCEVSDNQSLAKVAGLQLVNVRGLRVLNCQIFDNQGSSGTLLADCENVLYSNNTLTRNGGTGIRVFGSQNVQVEANHLRDHLGMHANGISVYLGSRDVRLVRNIVEGGGTALTLQSSQDVVADYNVFTSTRNRHQGVAIWPPSKGLGPMQNVTLRNNVIVNSSDNGLTNGDKTSSGLRLFNNIISGSLVSAPNAIAMSHNLYTTLSWMQKKPDWQWEPDAIKPGSKTVFVDAAAGNFRLAEDSPAIDAGINWGQRTDLTGAPIKGAPDIGAYEAGF